MLSTTLSADEAITPPSGVESVVSRFRLRAQVSTHGPRSTCSGQMTIVIASPAASVKEVEAERSVGRRP